MFSGVPKQGDETKIGYINPTFSGAHKWAEVVCNPGSPKEGTKSK